MEARLLRRFRFCIQSNIKAVSIIESVIGSTTASMSGLFGPRLSVAVLWGVVLGDGLVLDTAGEVSCSHESAVKLTFDLDNNVVVEEVARSKEGVKVV